MRLLRRSISIGSAAADDLAKTLIFEVAIRKQAKRPPDEICPLALEAGSLARTPRLKKLAEAQAATCSEH